MKKFSYYSLLFIAVGAMASCSHDNEMDHTDDIVVPADSIKSPVSEPYKAITFTKAEKTAVHNMNGFGFDLYKAIAPDYTNRNFVISPISASYLLGMLNAGAVGITSEEISSLLGCCNNGKTEINELCKKLIDELSIRDTETTFKLANCIVTDNSLTLCDQYKQDMLDYYNAEIMSADLSDHQTIDMINEWCANQTEGKIESIIDAIPADITKISMNATYFQARWTTEFLKEFTKPEVFIMQDGSTVDVDMMNSTFSSNYAANDCYATLELPFGENERWSFYALLPNEGKSVKDIMTMLDKDRWELNKQSLHTEMVNIKLPKFKSEMELELKRPLISLGATTMFTQDADFSLMTPDKEMLYTSTIMQNVYLKIDEEGAEAAAVTHEYMVGAHIDDNAKSVSVINFHANHPFIYMIQDKRSGAISFMGLYNGI